MEIFLVVIIGAFISREIMVQKKFKQLRITISTLLFIISEDPEKFEEVMQDIYNVGGFGEVE